MARNIVIIGSDSIRADHCGCYGYERETTPFLSSMIDRGVRFENPIVSGLATPNSFMGLFTGEHSTVEAHLILPEEWRKALNRKRTLAHVLAENEYNTYGFNTNALLSRYYGFNVGFQHYYDGLWTVSGEHKWWWKAKKFLVLPFLKRIGLAGHAINLKNLLKADIGYSRTEDWIGEVLNTKLEEPYLLWVFLVDTHHPYVPPLEYAKWGETGTRRMIWLNYKMRRQGHGEVAAEGNKWAMAQQKFEPILSPEERDAIINGYDAEILHVDAIVKQLWEHLKDTDPVFVFHSDHGDGLGEHGFYGHPPEHYEYLIRVPLVIYNSGRTGVIEDPVSFLGIANTICEIAGVDPEFAQPSLFNNSAYTPPIVSNKLNIGFRVTARDREWKLITNPDREDELYNIKEDPLETRNLIGVEKAVEKRLRDLIEETRATRSEQEGRRKAAGSRGPGEKSRESDRIGKLKSNGKV